MEDIRRNIKEKKMEWVGMSETRRRVDREDSRLGNSTHKAAKGKTVARWRGDITKSWARTGNGAQDLNDRKSSGVDYAWQRNHTGGTAMVYVNK